MPKAVAEKRAGGKAKKDPNAPKRSVYLSLVILLSH